LDRERDRQRAPRQPVGEVDMTRPSAARVYDYYLGGTSNFAIDREFAQRAATVWPDVLGVARLNRRWLRRVVAEAVRAGFTQFLDIGAGLPTAGNTHEIARREAGDDADLRVVYVDNEGVAHSYAGLMLDEQRLTGWCAAILDDARNPEAILEHADTQRLLDLGRPVCVLTVALWQFIGDGDDIPNVLARYRSRLAPGSWIAISHVGPDDTPPESREQIEGVRRAYADTQNPLWVRDRTEIGSWFTEMPLVAPGLVHLTEWRPEDDVPPVGSQQWRMGSTFWCGVGQIP
jgi:hypothetical protein